MTYGISGTMETRASCRPRAGCDFRLRDEAGQYGIGENHAAQANMILTESGMRFNSLARWRAQKFRAGGRR